MRLLLRWALLGAAGSALGAALLPDASETQLAAVQPNAVRALPAAARAAAPTAATGPAPVSPLAAAPGPSTAAEPISAAGAQGSATREPWPDLSATARRAWVPAPPLAPAPPPPAPPTSPTPPAPPAPPPAFPYQWLGQLEDEGPLRIFLAGPQRTLAVTPGDVLDEHWRVDGVQDGRLQLTWLPTATPVAVASRP